MTSLVTIGGLVAALSACTSGACVAIAYHVPARLRDRLHRVSDALLHAGEDEPCEIASPLHDD